jgi:TonB family protein
VATGYFRDFAAGPFWLTLVHKFNEIKFSPKVQNMNTPPAFRQINTRNWTKKALVALLLATPLLLSTSVDLHAQNASSENTRKIKDGPAPEYPAIAKQNGIKGLARVSITVLPDGSVSEVKELGGHPILIDALAKAVKKWKYEKSDRTSVIEVRCPFGT